MYLVYKESSDKDKEDDTKSPFFANSCNEGPCGDVVKENEHHSWDHSVIEM